MSMDEHDLYERREPGLEGWQRQIYNDVSKDNVWDTVKTLSKWRRQAGTEGEREAAEFLVNKLRSYNVPVETWDPELWVTYPEDASIRAVSPTEKSIDTETDRPVIKPQSWSGNKTVRGEAVYLQVPDVSVREFRNITIDDILDSNEDITGKIVVVGKQILSGRIAREVEERGAAGYIAVHPHEEEAHQRSATRIWGTIPTPDRAHLLPDIPLLTAAAPIGDQIKELTDSGSLKLEISAKSPREWSNCKLVIGKIPARSNTTGDFVLLHGHYDSIEFGVTDNATGNAGMVEIGRILNQHRDQLERDLWIAFWPNHERLYGGSTWFADEFANDIVDNCVAHVNMDSIGAKDATEFEEFVPWMPEAAKLCRDAIKDVTGKQSDGNRVLRASDYSFYNIGVTGMMGLNSSIPKSVREERGYHTVSGSGGNAEAWHLTTDTLDKADPDGIERDTRVYLNIVARLLESDVIPLDHRRSFGKGREIVENYNQKAGLHFDLSPVIREFDELEDLLESFYADMVGHKLSPQESNEIIKQLSRRLVPIDYVEGGRFEQDLMTQRKPFPSLEPATTLSDKTGDDLRFHRVELRRARNRVVHELKEAKWKLEAVVD